jgi:endoglucanase
MNGGRLGAGLVATGAAAIALAFGTSVASAGHSARAHAAAGCADPDVAAPRDPANPLALPMTPPSGDPLQGAHFFVDGPHHGQAAGAIASLLGMNPKGFADSDSWAAFKANHLAAINGNSKARQLVKIADREETQNVSSFAHGGGFGGISAQTTKLLCNNMSADAVQPTIPVLSTFFIYPNGQFCPSLSQIRGWQGTFKADVNGMASAIGSKRAVIVEEIDSIGASGCLKGGALNTWLADLKYESQQFSKLPHTVTYAEAGYSDGNAPGPTAARLWKAGVNQVRGFYTNGTHFAWSIDEIRWAQDVADNLKQLSRGRYTAHFVVNTAQNGRGPKRSANIVTQGFENLCNPPGRGLGRIPTGQVAPTFDGRTFKGLDGFLWTGVPGRSHNSSCPNGPWQPGGVFDPRFALELAQNANQKLGPGFPSRPY